MTCSIGFNGYIHTVERMDFGQKDLENFSLQEQQKLDWVYLVQVLLLVKIDLDLVANITYSQMDITMYQVL